MCFHNRSNQLRWTIKNTLLENNHHRRCPLSSELHQQNPWFKTSKLFKNMQKCTNPTVFSSLSAIISLSFTFNVWFAGHGKGSWGPQRVAGGGGLPPWGGCVSLISQLGLIPNNPLGLLPKSYRFWRERTIEISAPPSSELHQGKELSVWSLSRILGHQTRNHKHWKFGRFHPKLGISTW